MLKIILMLVFPSYVPLLGSAFCTEAFFVYFVLYFNNLRYLLLSSFKFFYCLFLFFVSARGSCKSYTTSRALPPYQSSQLLSGHNVNSRVIHRLSTGIIVHPNLSLISVLPYYIRVQLRIIRVCSEVRGVVGAYSVTLSCPTINSQNLCTMLVQQSNYHATSNWQALISGPRMDKRPWPWGWYGKINIGDSAQCEISRACLARKLLRVRACIMLDNGAVL